MEEVPWGVKMRVTVGAFTSMTDLLTDVYVTYMFWSDEKKYGYFKASLASLVASIGLQMLFVFAQNKKLGMKRVVREWIPILLGYKPAVDAYRVATGVKQEVGVAVDPMLEMTFMKCFEMFAEAIPGVIIQLMAIATSDKEVGTSAWLSVAVSAITTGFASATMSYDFDTDPGKREHTPDFYGYIPAKTSKEERDMIIGEKFEWEGKKGEVGRVVVVEREEIEGLREEREALEDEEVQVRGNAFDGTLGGKAEHGEGGCGGQEEEGGGQEAVGGRHEEDGGW
jgi:hypothetical protein